MTAANPQKVLSLLNERLAPHGVKCRDMTLVVVNDPSAHQKVCQNLEAHLDRAAIIFNASGHLDFLLTLLGGGPGAQWIFMQNDNFYCPAAGTSLSLDQQIDNAVKTVTGTDETAKNGSLAYLSCALKNCCKKSYMSRATPASPASVPESG